VTYKTKHQFGYQPLLLAQLISIQYLLCRQHLFEIKPASGVGTNVIVSCTIMSTAQLVIEQQFVD
jgi:hypothetical protein